MAAVGEDDDWGDDDWGEVSDADGEDDGGWGDGNADADDDDAWQDDDANFDWDDDPDLAKSSCRTSEGDVITVNNFKMLHNIVKLWLQSPSTLALLKSSEVEVSATKKKNVTISVVHADVGAFIFPLMLDTEEKSVSSFCESCTKSTIDIDEISADLAQWIFEQRRSVFSILDHFVRIASRAASALRKRKADLTPQKKTRSVQEPPYVICNRDRLADMQAQMINDTARHLEISRSCTACLLIHFNWDNSTLLKRWADISERPKICEEAQCLLALQTARESAMRRKLASLASLDGDDEKEGDVMCEICYEEFPPSRMVCCCTVDDHSFCFACFQAHCESLVQDTGKEAVWFSNKCPSCDERIGFEVFETVLDAALLRKYKHFFELHFEEKNANVTYCPTAKCEYVVVYDAPDESAEVLTLGKCSILCQCSNWFCFECHGKAHAPALCDHWKDWDKRDKGEEGLNAMAIKTLSKPCPNPKCSARVEKNGGCMFMTCLSCKQPFCWQCGQWGKGVHHVWECNRPPTKQWSDGLPKGEADEKRYQFYYERYFNHKDSLRIAGDQLKETQDKIQTALEVKGPLSSIMSVFKRKRKSSPKHAPPPKKDKAQTRDKGARRCVRPALGAGKEASYTSDAKFILTAVKLVHRCRHVLAMTYVKQFYLKKEDLLFMDMQAQLERYTDNLHGYIDKYSIKELCAADKRQAIINCCDSIGHFLRGVEEYRKVNAKRARFESTVALCSAKSNKSKRADAGLKTLLEMQLPLELSQRALEMCDGDANKAAQLILSGALGAL